MKLVFFLSFLLPWINNVFCDDLNYLNAICLTNSTSKTYNLDINDVVHFRSPNYPANMLNGNSTPSCKAQFQTKNPSYNIWIAIYNGITTGISMTDSQKNQFNRDKFDSYTNFYSFSTETSTLNFEMLSSDNVDFTDWIAFESIVLPYDPTTTSCPFEGTFEFINVGYEIPISSNFGTTKTISKNCQWIWNLPTETSETLYMKLVIQNLKINNNVTFTLVDGNNIHKKFDSDISEPTVFYFVRSDFEKFTMTWHDTNDASKDTGFNAWVSVITIPYHYVYVPCQFDTNEEGNITRIYNVDYQNGYIANVGCNQSITIPKGTETLLTVTKYYIERNVDNLSVLKGIDQKYLDKNNTLRLNENANGGFLRFQADGSIEEAGFEVTLKSLDCVCPDSIVVVIPCTDNFTISQSSYCNNQICTFKIISNDACASEYFEINIIAKLRTNLDYFLIINNGTSLENTSRVIEPEPFYTLNLARIFSTNTEIQIEFNSGLSTSIENDGGFWEIQIKSIDSLNISKINLNEDDSTLMTFLNNFDYMNAVSICSENDITQLFFSRPNKETLDNFLIYDGEGLNNNFIGSLEIFFPYIKNSSFIPSVTAKSNCLTILNLVGSIPYESTVYFRMNNFQSKNCMNDNNVFVFQYNDAVFKMEATNGGNCEIILLPNADFISLEAYGITIRSIDALSDNIYTIRNVYNQKLLMELNGNETDLWKDFSIYTYGLSIILPPSTYLNIAITAFNRSIAASLNNQNGILASPSYSGMVLSMLPIQYDISLGNLSFFATLTAKVGNETALIMADSGNYTLIEGQTITLEGGRFFILDSGRHPMDNDFLIEYNFFNINDDKNMTSSSTTTSTPATPATSTIMTTYTSPTTKTYTTSSLYSTTSTSNSKSSIITTQTLPSETLPSNTPTESTSTSPTTSTTTTIKTSITSTSFISTPKTATISTSNITKTTENISPASETFPSTALTKATTTSPTTPSTYPPTTSSTDSFKFASFITTTITISAFIFMLNF